MSYREKLFGLRQTGVKFSLDSMRNLAESIGHPERGLCFIHIAGTNGKGSVAAMCASIAEAAGLKVGLYTSPHLVSYRERFRVNGQMISEERLDEYLAEYERRGWPGTFFEITTAIALQHFSEERVDLVVWETGLGGRLDATNIVTPQVSVLTRIAVDHGALLGDSLPKIAAEKAAIIKPGIPSVSAPQQPEVLAVLRERAESIRSPLHVVALKNIDEFVSPLAGDHQRWNTAVAVAACRIALVGLPDHEIAQGLRNVQWPARAQSIPTEPRLILDGAHNPDAIRALARTVPSLFGNEPFHLIFGAAADKDIAGMAKTLMSLPGLQSVFLVPLASERSATPEQLREAFPQGRFCDHWEDAWAHVRGQSIPALVTGSFFLAGEVLAWAEDPALAVDAGELWKAV
ncbi:MAG: bifunctional folylpolyglutamate synthase/dihydrofolate synthase [Verrucomicrobiae bacterium]|nr:bifunctional folylpolyglutamate synthase/dihydrofolate synthase [Verrucomicrobiae bacterium]